MFCVHKKLKSFDLLANLAKVFILAAVVMWGNIIRESFSMVIGIVRKDMSTCFLFRFVGTIFVTTFLCGHVSARDRLPSALAYASSLEKYKEQTLREFVVCVFSNKAMLINPVSTLYVLRLISLQPSFKKIIENQWYDEAYASLLINGFTAEELERIACKLRSGNAAYDLVYNWLLILLVDLDSDDDSWWELGDDESVSIRPMPAGFVPVVDPCVVRELEPWSDAGGYEIDLDALDSNDRVSNH